MRRWRQAEEVRPRKGGHGAAAKHGAHHRIDVHECHAAACGRAVIFYKQVQILLILWSCVGCRFRPAAPAAEAQPAAALGRKGMDCCASGAKQKAATCLTTITCKG